MEQEDNEISNFLQQMNTSSGLPEPKQPPLAVGEESTVHVAKPSVHVKRPLNTTCGKLTRGGIPLTGKNLKNAAREAKKWKTQKVQVQKPTKWKPKNKKENLITASLLDWEQQNLAQKDLENEKRRQEQELKAAKELEQQMIIDQKIKNAVANFPKAFKWSENLDFLYPRMIMQGVRMTACMFVLKDFWTGVFKFLASLRAPLVILNKLTALGVLGMAKATFVPFKRLLIVLLILNLVQKFIELTKVEHHYTISQVEDDEEDKPDLRTDDQLGTKLTHVDPIKSVCKYTSKLVIGGRSLLPNPLFIDYKIRPMRYPDPPKPFIALDFKVPYREIKMPISTELLAQTCNAQTIINLSDDESAALRLESKMRSVATINIDRFGDEVRDEYISKIQPNTTKVAFGYYKSAMEGIADVPFHKPHSELSESPMDTGGTKSPYQLCARLNLLFGLVGSMYLMWYIQKHM